ncbi:FAD-dependent monooxygenase, partial [Acinetobacter baumannii]|uniref:FAD-dependent monooxygenase n=1 Tax=Acinetobacter baumannii TaxID=470 RepID=UPI001487C89E
VYGHTEVTKDVMSAREAAQLTSFYEAHNVQVKDFYTAPKVAFEYQGKAFQIQCDSIAECDGYHGVCSASVPEDNIKTFEKVYTFGWLGVLA